MLNAKWRRPGISGHVQSGESPWFFPFIIMHNLPVMCSMGSNLPMQTKKGRRRGNEARILIKVTVKCLPN